MSHSLLTLALSAILFGTTAGAASAQATPRHSWQDARGSKLVSFTVNEGRVAGRIAAPCHIGIHRPWVVIEALDAEGRVVSRSRTRLVVESGHRNPRRDRFGHFAGRIPSGDWSSLRLSLSASTPGF